MDLKEYEQRKFALAGIVRSAQAIDTKDSTLLGECRELLRRLAEDRFNLMVVGRFSRGKPTLMNAILGGNHLPTGIVPLTSVITTVRYGSRKQVVLHFINSSLSREVPLSQLADYVTQKENPSNRKKIAYAEIQLRLEILRRGLFFVDSPGLGSPIVENTLTTERFLPEADAFVLVTSYESPISEEEDRILQRIRLMNKRLFVVVNKQDTVRAADREDALRFVAERLQEFRLSDVSPIYSISARQVWRQDNSEMRPSSWRVGFNRSWVNFLTSSSQSVPNPSWKTCMSASGASSNANHTRTSTPNLRLPIQALLPDWTSSAIAFWARRFASKNPRTSRARTPHPETPSRSTGKLGAGSAASFSRPFSIF